MTGGGTGTRRRAVPFWREWVSGPGRLSWLSVSRSGRGPVIYVRYRDKYSRLSGASGWRNSEDDGGSVTWQSR